VTDDEVSQPPPPTNGHESASSLALDIGDPHQSLPRKTRAVPIFIVLGLLVGVANVVAFLQSWPGFKNRDLLLISPFSQPKRHNVPWRTNYLGLRSDCLSSHSMSHPAKPWLATEELSGHHSW
jgi:hypothetical protein